MIGCTEPIRLRYSLPLTFSGVHNIPLLASPQKGTHLGKSLGFSSSIVIHEIPLSSEPNVLPERVSSSFIGFLLKCSISARDFFFAVKTLGWFWIFTALWWRSWAVVISSLFKPSSFRIGRTDVSVYKFPTGNTSSSVKRAFISSFWGSNSCEAFTRPVMFGTKGNSLIIASKLLSLLTRNLYCSIT